MTTRSHCRVLTALICGRSHCIVEQIYVRCMYGHCRTNSSSDLPLGRHRWLKTMVELLCWHIWRHQVLENSCMFEWADGLTHSSIVTRISQIKTQTSNSNFMDQPMWCKTTTLKHYMPVVDKGPAPFVSDSCIQSSFHPIRSLSLPSNHSCIYPPWSHNR